MKRKHSLGHYARRIGTDIVRHPANRAHPYRALARGLGWQVRKRVVRRPIDVDYEGFVLRCYPDSNSASDVFYFTSRYDHHEMGFLDRYLRPGDGFLDVGANIGTYSLFVAARTGASARIEAFEALPRMAERLRENFRRNGLDQATVHQVAVGATAGRVGFLDFDVSSSVDHQTDRKGEVIEVEAATIDDRVRTGGFAVAKLDVEGVELQALEGAAGHLARTDPPVWLVEVFDHQLAKHGSSAPELVTWMGDRGYVAGTYDADRAELTFSPEGWRDHQNLIFVAESERRRVLARLAGADGARAIG